ncbi:hypothetical protein [Streptomyces roseoverticillatus]|uniref:B box-type domain-containing protein n=1 Tax=Streptomyces roseoverticillatus TaxID=66429 RepID=A0ABV3IM95_9ACTN
MDDDRQSPNPPRCVRFEAADDVTRCRICNKPVCRACLGIRHYHEGYGVVPANATW